MTKYTTLLITVAFSLFYSPLFAHTRPPFTTPSFFEINKPSEPGSKLFNFRGSVEGNKILLQWDVKENENANKFEVEKSTDGINFIMEALVFGTDKPESDNYMFYEKAISRKLLYRIKMINKDDRAEYSSVIEINNQKNN